MLRYPRAAARVGGDSRRTSLSHHSPHAESGHRVPLPARMRGYAIYTGITTDVARRFAQHRRVPGEVHAFAQADPRPRQSPLSQPLGSPRAEAAVKRLSPEQKRAYCATLASTQAALRRRLRPPDRPAPHATAHTTVSTTSILPRVALEYGQT